ncbi:MAG: hypothetical protein ACI4XW_03570 [Candidatus Spyradocola sp.]
MKRIRLILALMLCLALTCLCATGLAATKAATAVPTLKLGTIKGTLRGGVGYELTVTPSVAGFLSLRILDADGNEVAVVCESQELHTKANLVAFETSDPDGMPLPAGNYSFSATVTSQYGVVSKVATAKFALGDPRPEIRSVSVSTSKAFNPILSFYAFFSDKEAEVTFSLYRVSPKAAYFDDFPTVQLKAAGETSVTLDLTKGNDMPTAAGYYKAKGAIGEWYTSLFSEPVEVDFIVDVNGNAYLLADAPADALAQLDKLIAEYDAGTLKTDSLPKTTTASTSGTSSGSASGSTAGTSSSATSGTSTASTSGSTSGTSTASASGSTTGTSSASTAAAATDVVTYEKGVGVMGAEGLLIGVGVSDKAEQTDAGYWGLTSASTNEEIWAAITRTMTSVDVGESESAYIYDSIEEGRKRLGTVSGLSQGLNVVKELDSGWSLVEAFRNEDGAFVRGYIRSNKLRTVEPNQNYGLVIDKAAQTLTVWKDGAPIGSCSVSTGLPTTKYLYRETPAGEFITVTRRGTTEYYGKGYCLYTIRINGTYHIAEIPTTKKNGTDFSLLADSLGEKATRGYVCIAHDASTDGGINAEWIWNMTTDNKKVKVLILDDKDRSMVPVGE